jgi:hypothetical protein
VAGRNRVPRPAAGMTAFVIRSFMAVRSLSFAVVVGVGKARESSGGVLRRDGSPSSRAARHAGS